MSLMNKNIRVPLAYRLFETLIEDSSDRVLNEMYDDLIDYKTKYLRTYNSLRRVPFVRDLFDLILDQWAYRNEQMQDEEVLAAH
jgi:hypothetical protein